MPSTHPNLRRKLIALLFALPAIATAVLWTASHFWFVWYCSLPPGTKLGPSGFPPATKIRICAGAIHYTDDATLSAAQKANFSANVGSMFLGTSYDGATKTAKSGLSINWSPYGFEATRWKPEYFTGNWNLPLWLPFTILLVPPAFYWLLTRPRKPGVCAKCGYSRAGLARSSACPECGAMSSAG
ncbi:MAG: hypothetical protein QM783_12845 [Phycisphaerales bacterium]